MRILLVFVIGHSLLGSAFANFRNLPLSFEPNRGQADSNAVFLARGSGYSLSVERSGLRILLRRGGKSAQIFSRLLGASGHSQLQALEPLPGHSSYFRGADHSHWVTGVPNFARVRAAGVYPGIDLVYYGRQSELEYDFVVEPGADPGAIRMRFDGVTSVHDDEQGNLVLATPAGEITERKPVIYQTIAGERQPVHGRFVIRGRRTVSFELADYDRSKPLVIDPVLVYSSFLGGFDDDEGHAVAADAAGNLYLTGLTFSTPDGDADVLIRQISPDGSAFLYTADLGGSGDDIGNGIAVDATGSAYVGGRTSSIDFPTANAFQSANAGSNNAFVLRLDPTGTTLLFSTYVGGSMDDRGFALALDNQGNAYLTGAESSTDFPVTNGAFQTKNRGGLDCFVVKLDGAGNRIFSTLIGGGSDDQAFGIAVDGAGNSYITGQTLSDSYPQQNASFQHSRHGGLDAFITEITADGSALVYSTFAGGGKDDSASGIAVSPAGDAYIVGTTSSSDLPVTPGAYQTTFAGGATDIFVLGYSASGQHLIFSTFLGSHGIDDGGGIALDAMNNVYLTGDTNSDQFPVTPDALQGKRKGGFDVVISVLDPTGARLVSSTFLGGSDDDSGFGIALDPSANAYVTGVTSSSDFPVTKGVAQPQPGGGSDAFFTKVGFANPASLP